MVGILRRYYKLIIVMVFLVAAIFYGQFRYSSDLVSDISRERINDNFLVMNEKIEHWFQDKEQIVWSSKIFISNTENKDSVFKYLSEKLESDPDYKSLYFLSSENEMINASGFVPPPGIDFRERPWYVKAVEKEGRVITDVFLNASGNDFIVSIAEPVFDEKGLITGVVAGDISLSSINAILNSSTEIPGSKVILTDENNKIVSSSFDDRIPQDVLFEADQFSEGILLTGDLDNTNWKIYMHIPKEYISQPVNTIRSYFFVTIMIFIGTMFIFAFLQRKVIEEPLVSYELTSRETIKKERKNFEALFKNSSDAIAIVDNENNIIEINQKFEELFKYKQDEAKGKNIDNLIVTEERMREAKKFTELLFKEEVSSVETVRYDKFRNPKTVELKGIPIFLGGKVIGGYASYTDISVRKAYEQEILFMSYHDQLTGIYNRRYYEEKIKELDKEENYPLYLVMADLNGLKLANDAFGHSFGDKILIRTGEIISSYLKEDEFVARIGGDEFIIVLPKKSHEDFMELINNLSKEIEEAKVGTIDLSVSFGWEAKTLPDQNIAEIMNKAESFMYKRKLSESPSMVSSTIKIIISTLHEKNLREKQHSDRVGDICVAIATEMGFEVKEIEELKLVGLMHDIGKIGIDEKILNKEGRLTPEEYEEIKKHPEIGYRILSTANQMSEIAEYTLAHHERWDGTGYPNGIKGKEIPLVSRIIAVADAFDAMTSERSYRTPFTEKEAVEELRKHAGTQFDPVIVKIFTEKVLKY